jgi:predicted ester cyclase
MSEQNKEIARRFIQAFAAGDVTALEQIVGQDLLDHNPPPGARPGRQGLLDAVATFRAGFPDLQISIERMVAEGDTVVVYGTAAGSWRPGTSRTSPGCWGSWA